MVGLLIVGPGMVGVPEIVPEIVGLVMVGPVYEAPPPTVPVMVGLVIVGLGIVGVPEMVPEMVGAAITGLDSVLFSSVCGEVVLTCSNSWAKTGNQGSSRRSAQRR
jgi:hypothetical protein